MMAGRGARATISAPPGHGGILGRVSYPLLRTMCVAEPAVSRWIPGRGSSLSRYPVQLSDGGRARVGSGPAIPRNEFQNHGAGSSPGAVTCATEALDARLVATRTGSCIAPSLWCRSRPFHHLSSDSAERHPVVVVHRIRSLHFATHRTKPPSTSRCVSGSLPSARPPLCSSSTRTSAGGHSKCRKKQRGSS